MAGVRLIWGPLNTGFTVIEDQLFLVAGCSIFDYVGKDACNLCLTFYRKSQL